MKHKKHDYEKIKVKIEDFLYTDKLPASATKFLLMFLAIGGLAVVGAAVPGILKALKENDFTEDKTGFGRKQIGNALGSLRRQKLVRIINDVDGKTTIRLSNKGKERVCRFTINALFIKKPKRWDGKWRILIFDIPTRPKIYNLAREALRQKIKELGFYQLQKSTWVVPYECEDEILFIAEAYEVEKFIEIITAEKILHEEKLSHYFQLRS